MMPVPSHLRKCLVPNDEKLDEQYLIGKLRCPCGCKKFQFLYTGQDSDVAGSICAAEIDDEWFFVIKAKCISCGREHLLLDRDFHGWDGFICHDTKKALLPRPPVDLWKCRLCGCLEHTATVEISPTDKEEFHDVVREEPEKFQMEMWPDAFEWFIVSLQCCNCAHKQEHWVDYEAA